MIKKFKEVIALATKVFTQNFPYLGLWAMADALLICGWSLLLMGGHVLESGGKSLAYFEVFMGAMSYLVLYFVTGMITEKRPRLAFLLNIASFSLALVTGWFGQGFASVNLMYFAAIGVLMGIAFIAFVIGAIEAASRS